MIELRKYKRIHVDSIPRAHDLVSALGLVRAGGGGGGRIYETKILRSNLAPGEGGGRLFEGGV